jgi:hypothetical protein
MVCLVVQSPTWASATCTTKSAVMIVRRASGRGCRRRPRRGVSHSPDQQDPPVQDHGVCGRLRRDGYHCLCHDAVNEDTSQ